MDRDAIKHLAELLDVDIASAPMSAKWINLSCPYAPWEHQNGTDGSPSFGVKIEKSGVSRMFCFSCGHGGPGLGEVVMDLKKLGAEVDFKGLNELAMAEFDGSELPSFDIDDDEKECLYPFGEDWLDSFPKAVNNGHALVYLASRQIPTALTAMIDLHYDPFDRRVLFPIRGENKVLYGLHGRAVDEGVALKYMAYGYKKRRNPHVLLGLDTIDWSKPVVYAESVFDYARTKQVYRNVLTGLHATVSEAQLEMLEPAFELVTLFDGDKAGSLGRQKIKKWAGKKRVVHDVYLPDGTDAGQMTPQELAAELEPFVDLDGMIL